MMLPYSRKSPNPWSSFTEINLFPIFKTKQCFGCVGGSVIRIHLPMQERRVQSMGREDFLEKEMATHFVFFPGESHGKRSLADHSP